MNRRPSKRLVSTYVEVKPSGKFAARAIDGRTRREARCVKDALREAIDCSREKAST